MIDEMEDSDFQPFQPWFFLDSIVPLTIDVAYFGSRYVDSICWNKGDSTLTSERFATQTCIDMSLPNGFIHRIELQVIEQLKAYDDLMKAAKYCIYTNKDMLLKFKDPIPITIKLRKNLIEYHDQFYWSLVSNPYTPEDFARFTCKDLGLPTEFESMISYKIREYMYKQLIIFLDNDMKNIYPEYDTLPPNTMNSSSITTTTTSSSSLSNTTTIEKKAEFITKEYPHINLLTPQVFIDMVNQVWKKYKLNHMSETMPSASYAVLPKDVSVNTNAHVWTSTN